VKNFVVLLIFLILPFILFAQTNKVAVEFVVMTKNLNYEENVFIVGNSSELGNWQPDAIQLDKVEENKFSKTIFFPVHEEIEFKFTIGSWSTEEVTENGLVPANKKLYVSNDTSVTYIINRWRKPEENISFGQITGTVEYITNIKTKDELLPRDIIIWLPPDYYENVEKRYPVLYMHDGQNIIDPSTSFLGIDWQIDETADSLIRRGIIEPIIIVGLYNTSNRRKEYSENDTGYAYINFLIDDVKPLIDHKYRTKSDRQNTAVAGSSMGGLISFMIAWERPDVFSKAACLSPALKIRNYDYVDNVFEYKGEKKNLLLYVDNGSVGLEDSLQTGIDEMLLNLRQKGFIENKDYIWFKDYDAKHNENAWAKRSWRFLELFFAKGN
jgi:predicted alpha/beta superfamily hydrolase